MSDLHKHKCPQCKIIWQHDGDELTNFIESHSCPHCLQLVTEHYTRAGKALLQNRKGVTPEAEYIENTEYTREKESDFIDELAENIVVALFISRVFNTPASITVDDVCIQF